MYYRIVRNIVFALVATQFSAAFADLNTGKEPEWMKYTRPGDGHKIFKGYEGNWKHTMKWWMKPGDKPEEHKGTNTNKWIMGGRFFQAEAKGKAMGQPFNGMGLTGYDTMKEQYQSVWIDNMGTTMVLATGKYDAATKTLKEEGTFADAMTGEKDKWFRTEWNLSDKKSYTYAMYTKDAEGKEFKSLEIIYTK